MNERSQRRKNSFAAEVLHTHVLNLRKLRQRGNDGREAAVEERQRQQRGGGSRQATRWQRRGGGREAAAAERPRQQNSARRCLCLSLSVCVCKSACVYASIWQAMLNIRFAFVSGQQRCAQGAFICALVSFGVQSQCLVLCVRMRVLWQAFLSQPEPATGAGHGR